MRAVTYHAFRGPLAVETLPDPVPPPHGVLIAVEATGLCRSDWHGWQGHDPDIRRFPHVPGHELAGTIAALGPDVAGWAVGDRVTTPFVCGCGTCPACARGDAQVCARQTQPGFTHWGAYAELVAVHHADRNLVAVPPELPMVTAASLGCRFATAFRAVVDQGRVREGEWVAVHGCGGVGLSAVMIAAAHGARVIAVDLDPRTLARAQALGAEVVLEGATTDVVAAIVTATGGGADASLDALGSAQTATNSLRCLRSNGRHVQVGLLVGADHRPALPMELVIARELEILGSHGMAAHAYPRMMAMILDGRLAPDQLIARTIGLEDVAHELPALERQSAGGVVVIIP